MFQKIACGTWPTPFLALSPGDTFLSFWAIKNAQCLFGCGSSQCVLPAGMCGHGHAAVEAFLGRVSERWKSIAPGEDDTKDIAAGKAGRCWISLEIEM